MLKRLWAPHIDSTVYQEVQGKVDNVFFAGYSQREDDDPEKVDPDIYLDAQSWSTLSLGSTTSVLATDSTDTTLSIALQFLTKNDQGYSGWLDYDDDPITNIPFVKVTNKTIFSGTNFSVSSIDGFKEKIRDRYYQTSDNPIGDFVWSEGSEGVVAAYYLCGDTTNAEYYHDETESYMLSNGSVPYSTMGVLDSAAYKKPAWSFTDSPSIAGTAWFLFNEPDANGKTLNPFAPVTFVAPAEPVFEDDFESYTSGDQPTDDNSANDPDEISDWTDYSPQTTNFWAIYSDGSNKWMRNTNTWAEQKLQITTEDTVSLVDFTFAVDIKFPSTNCHQAGMYFRIQNNSNYYVCYLEEGQSGTSTWAVVFGKIYNSSFTKLAGAGIGETIATNKTYRLKEDADGSTIKCYVDKGSGFQLIINQTDNTFSSAGYLGFRGYNPNGALWDNVEIWDQSSLSKKVADESNEAVQLPFEFALHQNYPNPFNPTTLIRFEIPENSHVRLDVFNILGQKIRTLIQTNKTAGHHHIIWDATDNLGNLVANGIYFYRLDCGHFIDNKKMILLR